MKTMTRLLLLALLAAPATANTITFNFVAGPDVSISASQNFRLQVLTPGPVDFMAELGGITGINHCQPINPALAFGCDGEIHDSISFGGATVSRGYIFTVEGQGSVIGENNSFDGDGTQCGEFVQSSFNDECLNFLGPGTYLVEFSLFGDISAGTNATVTPFSDGGTAIISGDVTEVPEPSPWWLAGLGVAGMAVRLRSSPAPIEKTAPKGRS